MATGDDEQIEAEIIESLEIHSNVLKISHSDSSVIEMTRSAINMPDGKITGFKGHKLSSKTMYNTLPVLLLQLYANPCLYWLHVPAFYTLAESESNDLGIFFIRNGSLVAIHVSHAFRFVFSFQMKFKVKSRNYVKYFVPNLYLTNRIRRK